MYKYCVSVIVPIFNVEKYLIECLDSVVNQTLKDLEIIIIDDGSTDLSGKIADNYAKKDQRISVIHQENSGLSISRNVGINKSNGKYIYFLDGDDYLDLCALETLYNLAEKDNLEIVKFSSYSLYDKIKIINWDLYKYKGLYRGVYNGLDLLDLLIANKDYSIPCSYLLFIKRDFIISNKIYFYEHIIHEDILFFLKIMVTCTRVLLINTPLYYRRFRDASITSSLYRADRYSSIYTSMVETEKLMNRLPDKNIKTLEWFVDDHINMFMGWWIKSSFKEKLNRNSTNYYKKFKTYYNRYKNTKKIQESGRAIKLFFFNRHIYAILISISKLLRGSR